MEGAGVAKVEEVGPCLFFAFSSYASIRILRGLHICGFAMYLSCREICALSCRFRKAFRVVRCALLQARVPLFVIITVHVCSKVMSVHVRLRTRESQHLDSLRFEALITRPRDAAVFEEDQYLVSRHL